MLMDRAVRRMPTSPTMRLMAGSMATALAISLGMIWIVGWFGIRIGPAIPSALAAAGAALFAARARITDGGKD